MQWKNNSTSHSTQPNPWMDPTHVHLWAVCTGTAYRPVFAAVMHWVHFHFQFIFVASVHFVVARSFSDDSEIRYVFPVSWLSSCFLTPGSISMALRVVDGIGHRVVINFKRIPQVAPHLTLSSYTTAANCAPGPLAMTTCVALLVVGGLQRAVYIGCQWRNFFTSAVFRHFVGQTLRNVCHSDASWRHFLNLVAIVRTFSETNCFNLIRITRQIFTI